MNAANLPTRGPDLVTWATNVIPGMVDFFTLNNVDLPARRRIVPGQLQLDAWDCEQVSVGFAGIADTGARGQGVTMNAPRTGTPFSATKQRQAAYGIQIVRCIGPCGAWSTSDTEDTDAAGRQMLVDIALLSQYLINLASAPPEWHPEGVNVDTGSVTPIGPDGGYYAIEGSMTFTVMNLMAAP